MFCIAKLQTMLRTVLHMLRIVFIWISINPGMHCNCHPSIPDWIAIVIYLLDCTFMNVGECKCLVFAFMHGIKYYDNSFHVTFWLVYLQMRGTWMKRSPFYFHTAGWRGFAGWRPFFVCQELFGYKDKLALVIKEGKVITKTLR